MPCIPLEISQTVSAVWPLEIKLAHLFQISLREPPTKPRSKVVREPLQQYLHSSIASSSAWLQLIPFSLASSWTRPARSAAAHWVHTPPYFALHDTSVGLRPSSARNPAPSRNIRPR